MFKVPIMRVMVHIDPEYKAMMFALDKLAIGNTVLRMQIKSNINRPYILIMEYIPGFDFKKILYNRAHMFLHPDIMKGYNLDGAPLLEVIGQSLIDYTLKESPLIVFGKIIISDIIMNNPDRIPSIWPNKGN